MNHGAPVRRVAGVSDGARLGLPSARPGPDAVRHAPAAASAAQRAQGVEDDGEVDDVLQEGARLGAWPL